MKVTGRCLGARRVKYTYPARYRVGQRLPAEKREDLIYVYRTDLGLVFSSSPHGPYGRYWLEGGPASSLEELYKMYGLTPVGPYIFVDGLQLIPCKGEFEAEVEFQTLREERAFQLAMAHTGGIAALTNKEQGYRAVDEKPAPGPIPEPEPASDDEAWILKSLNGPKPELVPIRDQFRLNFSKGPHGDIDDVLRGSKGKIRWWVKVCPAHREVLTPFIRESLLLPDGEAVGECNFCVHPDDFNLLIRALEDYLQREINRLQDLLKAIPMEG